MHAPPLHHTRLTMSVKSEGKKGEKQSLLYSFPLIVRNQEEYHWRKLIANNTWKVIQLDNHARHKNISEIISFEPENEKTVNLEVGPVISTPCEPFDLRDGGVRKRHARGHKWLWNGNCFLRCNQVSCLGQGTIICKIVIITTFSVKCYSGNARLE